MLEGFMKICMPVAEQNGMNSIVFGHFGSAPFFAIYDTESKSLAFVDNNESEHEHGQCMPVDAIRKTGAEAVLCRGMGMRAASLLIQAGIKACIVDGETVSEAIAQYNANKVSIINETNACNHHGCH
jgi:predicted Fe-Mo cluster-binding NifX family protein